MKNVRLLVMDVDGTLTDGGIYIGVAGEIMKKFSAKDGYGIHDLLPRYNIIPAIITGRESEIVKNRCDELGVLELYQNCQDKVAVLDTMCSKLGLTREQVAYIGDDMNDIDVMKCVGLRGCPADAANEIKQISNFISTKNGGDGAVREFIEFMISKELFLCN